MNHQRKQWNVDPDSQPPIIVAEDQCDPSDQFKISDVSPSHAEYLLQLQARNRVLRQLQAQSEQERQRMCREYGFNVYVNGANSGKQQEKRNIKNSRRKVEEPSLQSDQLLKEAERNYCQGWPSELNYEPSRAKTAPEKHQRQRKNWQVGSVDVKTTLGQSIRIKAPTRDNDKYEDDFEDDDDDSLSSDEEEVEEDIQDSLVINKQCLDRDSTDEVSTDDESESTRDSCNIQVGRSVEINTGNCISHSLSRRSDTTEVKYLNSPAPPRIRNTSGLMLARIKSPSMERVTLSVKDVHQLRQSLQTNSQIRSSLSTPLQSVQPLSVRSLSHKLDIDRSRSSAVSDKYVNQSTNSSVCGNRDIQQTSNTRLCADDTVVIEFPPLNSAAGSFLSYISHNVLMSNDQQLNSNLVGNVSKKTDEIQTLNITPDFYHSASQMDWKCANETSDVVYEAKLSESDKDVSVSATGIEHFVEKVLQLDPKGQQHLLRVLSEIEHNTSSATTSRSDSGHKSVSISSQRSNMDNNEVKTGASLAVDHNHKHRKNTSETITIAGSEACVKKDNNNNIRNNYTNNNMRNMRISKCSDVAGSLDGVNNEASSSSSVQIDSSSRPNGKSLEGKSKSPQQNEFKSNADISKRQKNQGIKFNSKVNVTIDLMTNWGHSSRIGLTEIQLFDMSGNKVQVQDIGCKYAHSERGTVSLLVDGKMRTTKERHMWSSALHDGSSDPVRVAMCVRGCSLSKMKIWNYNLSVGDTSIGAKRIRVKVEGQGLVFDGDLNRAVGNEVFEYGMTISLNKKLKTSEVVEDLDRNEVQVCAQSNSIHQNSDANWLHDESSGLVAQAESRGSQARNSTSSHSVASTSDSTSVSKVADRIASSAQENEGATDSPKTNVINDLFNTWSQDKPTEPLAVKTSTGNDEDVSKLGYAVDSMLLRDEACSKDELDFLKNNKTCSISPGRQSDDDSLPMFLRIQQLAKERKRQLATPEDELVKKEEFGNKLKENKLKSENFDTDWLDEKKSTGDLVKPASAKSFNAAMGQAKHSNSNFGTEGFDLDEILSSSSRGTDRTPGPDGWLDLPEEDKEDKFCDGWLDAPELGQSEKSASFHRERGQKTLKKELRVYDIDGDPTGNDEGGETLTRSVTPMQQIERSVKQRRRNLEDSWTSLDLFNKLQKGRLSVDLGKETMNEYLTAHAASTATTLSSSLYEQPSFGGRRVLSGATLGFVGEEGEGEVDMSEFEIPELPYGRELVINIRSTWGDRHYVGLNGIEMFSDSGCPARVRSITAEPSDINILPDYNDDPRVVDNLLDGVNRTTDDTHMWLAPFSAGKEHKIIIRLESSTRLAVLRIWNYNKSRVHSTRGAKLIEITFDGVPIFVGEIARASGTPFRDCHESYGDTILFTIDENILELVSRNDSTFELNYTDGEKLDDIVEDDTSLRPATADEDEDESRPYTSAAYLPSSVSNDSTLDQIFSETSNVLQSQVPPEMPVIDLDVHQSPKKQATVTYPAGRHLTLNFTSTWGDPHYLGLTGIEVIDEFGQTIPLTSEQLSADPRDLRILPGYEDDDRTLDKLVDGVNLTMDDCHMWLIPFTAGERHEVLIDLLRVSAVSALRVWNYNKSIEDTYRGARTVQVHLDGVLITPPDPSNGDSFLIRKGPGNSYFDFAQNVHFVQVTPLVSPNRKRIEVSEMSKSEEGLLSEDEEVNDDEYEWALMPRGFIYQLQLLSTWGDHYYIGLNGLELYDANGYLVHLNPSNITAFPESVNALKRARTMGTVTCGKLVGSSAHGSVVRSSAHGTLVGSSAHGSVVRSSAHGSVVGSRNQPGLGTLNTLSSEVEDMRTPDKLIDGIHETCDGRHMWLAPILPGVVNRIYILFNEPMEISAIKIWNYGKTSSRCVKDFALLVDDLMVYSGTMETIGDQRSATKGPRCHTVRFTRSLQGRARSDAMGLNGMHSICEEIEEQEIRLMNDRKEMDAESRSTSARGGLMSRHVLQKSVDQSLRPNTCVPRRGGKMF